MEQEEALDTGVQWSTVYLYLYFTSELSITLLLPSSFFSSGLLQVNLPVSCAVLCCAVGPSREGQLHTTFKKLQKYSYYIIF